MKGKIERRNDPREQYAVGVIVADDGTELWRGAERSGPRAFDCARTDLITEAGHRGRKVDFERDAGGSARDTGSYDLVEVDAARDGEKVDQKSAAQAAGRTEPVAEAVDAAKGTAAPKDQAK